MVNFSFPSANVDKLIPRVNVFPEPVIVDGLLLTSVATPPLIENVKSVTSRSPLPLSVLNGSSLKVTSTVLLSTANVASVIIGGIDSSKYTVLLS